MLILGIETSCDETGAAVIQASTPDRQVTLLSNVIATSLTLHAKTGGIIPEIAAREQVKYLLPVIHEAVTKAGISLNRLDAIAVTYGPGLIGSLLVGVETAKTLAYVYQKPIIPVNHMYGHIYANWIDDANGVEHRAESSNPKSDTIAFPALALVVSGGHTDLILLKNHGDLVVIGGTRDDAAGEAFDKIGRLLGLPYPAGPQIANLAQTGNPKAFSLPRPMIGSGDYDFSFSGLKTALLNLVKKNDWDFSSITTSGNLHDGDPDDKKQLLSDICASVEEAIVDIIVRKTLKAAKEYEVKSILLGGGVAANQKLTVTLHKRAQDQGLKTEISIPPKSLCTDNAAMIAAAGFYNRKTVSWKEIAANPELYY